MKQGAICPLNSCISTGGWGLVSCLPTLLITQLARAFYNNSIMSTIYIGSVNKYNHQELTINVPAGTDVNQNIRTFFGKEQVAEDVTPAQEVVKSDETPDEELFKYIHVAVTDDNERLQIHKQVCNIVRLPKMQQICDELFKLMKNKKVLCTINPDSMLVELRRVGMPSADTAGFSDPNFFHYYKAPKLD